MIINKNVNIGIDSQCFSYLIDALNGISEPTCRFAYEKISLYRLYIYLPGIFYVAPTVLRECLKIPNIDRQNMHSIFSNSLFDEIEINNIDEVEMLYSKYKEHHSGENDCRILAEAVHGKINIFATYDNNFISRLCSVDQRIRIDKPSNIWKSLDIPKGTEPYKMPSQTNPLSKENWWKW